MKRILFLVLCILAFQVAAEITITKNELIGKWKIIKVVSSEGNTQTMRENAFYIFNSNGIMVEKVYGETGVPLKYYIKEGKLMIKGIKDFNWKVLKKDKNILVLKTALGQELHLEK